MTELIIKKGNLYNELQNSFDTSIIDSSQYDLEVTVNKDINYYRIRTFASVVEAKEVNPISFVTPKYNKYGVQITEIENFRKTYLFKDEFQYHRLFQENYFKNDNHAPSYYAFLQRITGKKNINNSKTLYRFSVPAIGNRKKEGVVSYDVNIELVKNRFYVVFFKENVEKGYFQNNKPQYIIYEKNDFIKAKKMMGDSIIDFAIETGYPLNLLQYVYIMTGGDEELTSYFFKVMDKIYSFDELCQSKNFPFIKPNVKNGQFVMEMTRYIQGEQDDINYSFNNKNLIIKK